MHLVQNTCRCDKSNTVCIQALSAPQADGSSMPGLVALPDTAFDANSHQLVFLPNLEPCCFAFIGPCMAGQVAGQGAKHHHDLLYVVS